MSQFLLDYVPGFGVLVFMLFVHIILFTISHIKTKDFSMARWPEFLKTWVLFMAGIVIINATVKASASLVSRELILPVVGMLQLVMYGGYFSYYLDNIFKHLSAMGLPIGASLVEVVQQMWNKIKGNTFTGGNL